MADAALSARVGMRVRALRKRFSLSQEELAFKAGCGVASVGRLERGELNATMGLLDGIARGLGVPALALFDFEETPERESALSGLKRKLSRVARMSDSRSIDMVSRMMDAMLEYRRRGMRTKNREP